MQYNLTWHGVETMWLIVPKKKCVFGSPHIQDNSSFYWIPKRNIYIPILIHFWDAPQIRLLITKTWKKCRFWLSKPYPCFTPMVWIKLGAPLGDGRFHRPLHGHFQLGGELLPLLLSDDGTIGGLAIWKLLKTTHWRTDYFLPSPPTDILTLHLAFYLTCILTYHLAVYLTYIYIYHFILSGILFNIYVDILSGILYDILSDIYTDIANWHWNALLIWPCRLWRLLFEARGWNRASNQEPE